MSHKVCCVEGRGYWERAATGTAGTISGFWQRESGILKRFRAGQFNDVVQIVALRDGSYFRGFFSNEFCGFDKQWMTVKCVQSEFELLLPLAARYTQNVIYSFTENVACKHIANNITQLRITSLAKLINTSTVQQLRRKRLTKVRNARRDSPTAIPA